MDEVRHRDRAPRRCIWHSTVIAAALLFAATTAAEAQLGYPRALPGEHAPTPGQPQQRQQQQQTQPPVPLPPPMPGEAWPWLEDGALLCKSRDGLVRYQTQLGNGASIVTARQGTDCTVLRKRTSIKIVDRDGPSRTEIVTNDAAKQTGWTNTFLPDTPPPDATKQAGK